MRVSVCVYGCCCFVVFVHLYVSVTGPGCVCVKTKCSLYLSYILYLK